MSEPTATPKPYQGTDYPWSGVVPYDLYRVTSKDAFVAVVLSLLSGGGDHLEDAVPQLVAELEALAAAGIIPRRPPLAFRGLADADAVAHREECEG